MLVSSLSDDETVDVDKVKWILVVEKEVWHLYAQFRMVVTDPELGDIPITYIFKPMGFTSVPWDFDHGKFCHQN